MLISSGTLVSKCCQAVILMDGNKYECSKCLKHCESGGTIGELHAPKRERERLERQVVEAALRLRRSARALKAFWDEHDENAPHAAMGIYDLAGDDVAAREVFDTATDALIDFESQTQGEK